MICIISSCFPSRRAATEVFFNKATDLLMWKKVNRQRREATLLVSVMVKVHGSDQNEDPDVQ